MIITSSLRSDRTTGRWHPARARRAEGRHPGLNGPSPRSPALALLSETSVAPHARPPCFNCMRSLSMPATLVMARQVAGGKGPFPTWGVRKPAPRASPLGRPSPRPRPRQHPTLIKLSHLPSAGVTASSKRSRLDVVSGRSSHRTGSLSELSAACPHPRSSLPLSVRQPDLVARPSRPPAPLARQRQAS